MTGNLGQTRLVKRQLLEFQSDSCEDWQAGAVMYTEGSDCIGLMDDFSVLWIQRNEMSNFKLIGGTVPTKIESLVTVKLKDPRDKSSDWIRKFITANWKEQSALTAVAWTNKELTENYPSLQFTEVRGKGGYIKVLLKYNVQSSEYVAVKMELCKGCPDFKFQSLWRESNIFCEEQPSLPQSILQAPRHLPCADHYEYMLHFVAAGQRCQASLGLTASAAV
jgi:hypothetical protein